MLTVIGSVVGILLFFAFPCAVVLAALGFWLLGAVGAVIGAVIGLLLQSCK